MSLFGGLKQQITTHQKKNQRDSNHQKQSSNKPNELSNKLKLATSEINQFAQTCNMRQ
jgi:uncharacterized FlaG/YvyC family protein